MGFYLPIYHSAEPKSSISFLKLYLLFDIYLETFEPSSNTVGRIGNFAGFREFDAI